MFKLIADSAGAAAASAHVLSAVVPVSGIVASAPAFQNILTWLIGLDILFTGEGVISASVWPLLQPLLHQKVCSYVCSIWVIIYPVRL